ncbi:uncharacterized protein BJX67DRAFT_351487 [Aspergillus lucknowensis]|uniref:Uncharacterized protein n=1 Tax=Aspergillus lucknowensis TaxID=176173 RepID=A0ABR4LTL7_9EURO
MRDSNCLGYCSHGPIPPRGRAGGGFRLTRLDCVQSITFRFGWTGAVVVRAVMTFVLFGASYLSIRNHCFSTGHYYNQRGQYRECGAHQGCVPYRSAWRGEILAPRISLSSTRRALRRYVIVFSST